MSLIEGFVPISGGVVSKQLSERSVAQPAEPHNLSTEAALAFQLWRRRPPSKAGVAE